MCKPSRTDVCRYEALFCSGGTLHMVETTGSGQEKRADGKPRPIKYEGQKTSRGEQLTRGKLGGDRYLHQL